MMKRFLVIFFIVLGTTPAFAEEYQLYFGGTHSHTSFSDGVQLVDQAWDTARNGAHADFWAVTDHYQQFVPPANLPSVPPNTSRWKYELDVALAKTEDGKFIPLVGWEWSDGIQGHMNVLFDPTEPPPFLLTGTFSRFVSWWLKKHPRAITGFNHPFWSADNKMKNFENFTYIPELASQAVYIEVCNPEDIPFYYIALDRGWRVAPLAAQDNHGPDWGLAPEYAAVYASALTPDSLRDAFIDRRFYATTDRTLKIRFDGNEQPMGSYLSADKVNFTVTVSRDGEPPAFLRIVTNGGTVQKEWTPTPGEFRADYTLPVEFEGVRWFVAYAAMPNGKFSISAPIWVRKP